MMSEVPRDTSFDSTSALLADPYRFVGERCKRYGADLFRTRIMLRGTICVTGAAAAELFYDPERFSRQGASPEPVRATLFGKGGVQGLDGAAHRHRKQMFMSLLGGERVSELARVCEMQWQAFAEKWIGQDRVVLYSEVQELLTRAVCAWAGVPLSEHDVQQGTRELVALFDKAGAIGLGHFWSRIARKRAEHWISELVADIRSGRASVRRGSAAHTIAMHRELDGKLLEPRIAAIEILNVLRPTVANAVFIVFAAHALHSHPHYRGRVASDPDFAELFVQEVRRFYPFFPSVMAWTRRAFQWRGYHFPANQRVMLDLYGTNHDSRTWEAPDEFRPERFQQWDRSAFNFVPQGGGDHYENHRCPGEGITIELLNVAVKFLAGRISYDIPHQDLQLDYARLPALPRSRFIMERIRMVV